MEDTRKYMQVLWQKALHIVLVTPRAQDCALLRAQLGANIHQKYQFSECSSGKEALHLLSRHNADCMILDMSLPDMTGNDLLLQLSQQQGHISLPIIMLTDSQSGSGEDLNEYFTALRLGAQDYMPRSGIHADMLVRAIYKAIERFRLTRQLKEKEEQYRFAIEAAQLGTWRYDATSDRFDFSIRSADMLGIPRDTQLNLHTFLELIHENDRAATHAALRQALEKTSHPNVRAEYRLPRESGETYWINMRGRVQLHEDLQSTIIGTILDVTERRYAEALRQEEMEMLDALYRVGQAFATTDSDNPLQFATAIATELTKADFGAFFYNDSEQSHAPHTFSGINHGNIELPALQKLMALFSPAEELQLLRIADIRQHPRYKASIPNQNITSLLTFPVVSQRGEVLGRLIFSHMQSNMFTERAERIAKAIAAQIAIGLENEHLLQSVREGEQRWRHLAEAMPQLVWVDRPDGYCEYLSSQWQQYTGIPAENLLGYEWLKILHPDDQARTAAAWQAALEGRAEYNTEYRIRRHDGTYRWFKTRGLPIRDEHGRINAWYGTCTDIHEQKMMIDEREMIAHELSHRIKNI
ncbi:MAG: PAS domain S-box protein, partial [Proteobacteria bacterium]|nr:PAS domain S-box protein [Pseudomonadota bacterium]